MCRRCRTHRPCGWPRASKTGLATATACRTSARSCATASRTRAKHLRSSAGHSMSEAAADGATSAGRLLREAREARRMPIAALASAIKVAPRKLEMLEADRFDQLVDPTFARALAQTVCRSLKIDAAPVLAL